MLRTTSIYKPDLTAVNHMLFMVSCLQKLSNDARRLPYDKQVNTLSNLPEVDLRHAMQSWEAT